MRFSQAKLEERLRQEMNEKLAKLAEAINCQSVTKEQRIPVTAEPCGVSSPGDVAIHQQLIELEQEKLQLRKELQEAVSKRKSAEATTEKLERLVGILRKKINGVSLESSMPDEKQSVVRPLASSLEKNPFIIANNRQGQKQEVLPFQKPKVIPLKAFSSENLEVTNLVGNENKENEAREAGNGNEQSSHGHPVSETASVTAQVTITGPVTDL
ncbi:hypothetical protein RUM44_001173 [Polyplax serrata]|uniref:Uncharacterized protein n=1 Tax=Polyplax serrata TaxID=468196 RepID=A0ABR1B9N8_POLSC